MMRHRFPIFSHQEKLIYFDSAATSHKPREVIDAITRFYEQEYATVHRAVYQSASLASDLYEQARETVRQFLHAQYREEIVFTRGATDAINLVALSYGGSNLKPGDEILISEMEHHSNFVPWQMIAEKTGASLKLIPFDATGTFLWEGMITDRTKIVAIAHISNVTGTIHPIKAIIQAAHKVGAVCLIDGAQAAAHLEINVMDLDCDFYAFSGHKCYGPTGIGVLYGKKHLLERMPPIQGGGDMIQEVTSLATTYQEPPLRFEAGTPIIASVIGLKTALEFIQSLDRQAILAHETALLTKAQEGMLAIDGLQILGTAVHKGPIITFHIPGIHSLDLATLLDLQHIAIRSGHLCAQPLLKTYGLSSVSRISFAMYNSLDEVDFFLNILQKLCLKNAHSL